MRERTAQRDQALARLSRITTATAVAGTFATVGFGGLAAITYTGNSNSSDSNTVTPAGSANGDQGQTQSAQQAAPTATPRQGTSHQQPVTINPPTVTQGRSHVRTGGS
jgi:hypothetical protein